VYRGTFIVVMALVAATVVPFAGAGVAVADAGGPTITLRADGTTLSDGDSIRTASNPTLDIEATASATIDVVSVRIDGKTWETFSPEQNRVEYSLNPRLRSGTHTVTVVVTAGTTESVEATITKDRLGPEVNVTSPFTKDRDDPMPNRVVLSDPNVTLSGRVFDQSRIETIRVERRYRFEDEGVHDVYTLTPGNSFEQSLFLGLGTNEITITTRDELDNIETHRVKLVVRDNRAPTVTVTDIHWISSTHVRIEGYAEDDVQLKSVAVGRMDVRDRRKLLAVEDRRPDRSGRHVEFTGKVSSPYESILLSATDHSGKTTTRGIPVSPFAVPEIRLDESATGQVDGAVVVEGIILRGAVTDVTVETVSESTGNIVDVAAVYHGRPKETRIPFETRLDAADGPTTVRVRALDATGTEHVVEYTVTPTTPEPTADPTVTDGPGDARTTGTPARTAEPGPGPDAAAADDDGIRLELPVVGVGVTIPGPSALGFTVGVPMTGLSFDVPGVGVLGGILVVLVLGFGVARVLR
jgi:hypothetical protein